MIRFSLLAGLTLLAGGWLHDSAHGWWCGKWQQYEKWQQYGWSPIADWWGKPYPPRVKWCYVAPRFHIDEPNDISKAPFIPAPSPPSSWLPFAYPVRCRDYFDPRFGFPPFNLPYYPGQFAVPVGLPAADGTR